MDDSCAVCAETLEWVAYGACGHREVCSTCVSRLRFICEDRRCCICKTESDVIFVTKALGDYTTTISDFSVFPSEPKEGKNGSYWYHEDTKAYFDDSDHYKMIKAMCRLSCSICDKEEQGGKGGNDGSKRKARFNNIQQLRSHLFHRHKKIMCHLCLEGRKIFICEQKLYTRAQLEQHISTGDSEVDGSESERGGFMGHPMCEFCKKPFYGDNELYTHMSTEHYTCHICQRQHPGQFEYYKNYDDLEMHFRSTHFLCENEACLAKKFIVFTSESEMKKHNALEHGGNMSRSKRNAVLQIPTSFQYRRSNEQDNRRGRGGGRGLHPDSSDEQLSSAIQASLETAITDYSNPDPSSSARSVPSHRERHEDDDIPNESSATAESEASSRYRQALGHHSRNIPLEESSFPPLPMAPPTSTQPKPSNKGLGKNTMAARLSRRNNGTVNVLNTGNSWSTTNRGVASSSSSHINHGRASTSVSSTPQTKAAMTNSLPSSSHASSVQARTTSTQGLLSSSVSATFPQIRAGMSDGSLSSSNASSSQSNATSNRGMVSSVSSASSSHPKSANSNGSTSSYVTSVQAKSATASSGSSSRNTTGTSWGNQSASFPDLIERGTLDASMSDFPPVSATKKNNLPASTELRVEDVQTANKSLVERIRSALEFDENKYIAFRDLSAEYRQGVIDAGEYLSYVQQFGLSHLVLELARLCPDPRKQRDLLDTYNASVRAENRQQNGLHIGYNLSKGNKSSKKGKGKCVEGTDIGSTDKLAEKSFKDTLADDIIGTVKKLQASYKPSLEEVEVLSKDGYRRSNGNNIKLPVPPEQLERGSDISKLGKSKNDIQSAGGGSSGSSSGGGGKQKKKTSKFHRARLGDGYDRQSDVEPEHEETTQETNSEALPVRGVWRHGGGQKLMSLTKKDPVK